MRYGLRRTGTEFVVQGYQERRGSLGEFAFQPLSEAEFACVKSCSSLQWFPFGFFTNIKRLL